MCRVFAFAYTATSIDDVLMLNFIDYTYKVNSDCRTSRLFQCFQFNNISNNDNTREQMSFTARSFVLSYLDECVLSF
jgi:hypothetical protein